DVRPLAVKTRGKRKATPPRKGWTNANYYYKLNSYKDNRDSSAASGPPTLSVPACCGRGPTPTSLLLGKAGLLDGKRATTHWRILEDMRRLFPAVNLIDDQHVVEDGAVITSAGISAGIDMALRVVARHHGDAVARATARHMEYPFPEDNRRRV